MSRHPKFQCSIALLLLTLLAACQTQGAQLSEATATAPLPTATLSTSDDRLPNDGTATSEPASLPEQGKVRPTAVPHCKTFAGTAYQVCDLFLTEWELGGGLLRFGLPLSDWFYEVDASSGETYRVQYFERHLIKLLQPPSDSTAPAWSVAPKVPLGSIVYNRKYPNGAPGQVADKSAPSLLVNPLWLGGRFGEFWANPSETRFMDGGEWFGMPISDVFSGVNETDGREYKVQYFEQAALELRPDSPPPNDVQFAPLGLYEFRHRYPNGVPNNPTPTPRPYVTPAPGLGCFRHNDLPPVRPTPAVSLAQAEASVRARYAQLNSGMNLGPMTISKHVSVDITGPQSDVEIFRDAWHLGFRLDAPTPTPYPTDVPGDMFDVLQPIATYNVYVDAETGQVLPGCEWGVTGVP